MEASQLKAITPEKLPDPWLIDSEYLLRELARVRELALRIPFKVDDTLPINNVIDALWRLEEQLRFLLRLHRDGQRDFAKRSPQLLKPKRTRKQTPHIAVIGSS